MSDADGGIPSRWRRIIAWLMADACALAGWAYFFLLNRTTVVRPYERGDERNVLFVANHQSPLDTVLIALAAYFPQILWRPSLHPWSLAAAEYWFRGRARAWAARHLRCIPVDRTRTNGPALRGLCAVLPSGVAILFPEGHRSRDGIIRDGFPGVGYVAQRTRPRIVPVAVAGLLDAMPYDDPRPRVGKRLRIAFGDPVDCHDLYAGSGTRASARRIAGRAMKAVRELHEQIAAPDD